MTAMAAPLPCEGKIAYESPHAAARTMHRIRGQRRGKERPSAYKCEHCGSWHLGRAFVGR